MLRFHFNDISDIRKWAVLSESAFGQLDVYIAWVCTSTEFIWYLGLHGKDSSDLVQNVVYLGFIMSALGHRAHFMEINCFGNCNLCLKNGLLQGTKRPC